MLPGKYTKQAMEASEAVGAMGEMGAKRVQEAPRAREVGAERAGFGRQQA